jgi:acyl-CoA thioester hydrolase
VGRGIAEKSSVERAQLDPAVAELLREFPIVVTTMVGWGDMDANSHVNNAVYFRYIEHARLKYFGDLGFSRLQHEIGIGPILAWTDCRFRHPLSYPDDVSIGARIFDVEDDRFMMHSIIVSHAKKHVAAEGKQRVVSYDYRHHHKATLPDEVRRKIEEFEGGTKK